MRSLLFEVKNLLFQIFDDNSATVITVNRRSNSNQGGGAGLREKSQLLGDTKYISTWQWLSNKGWRRIMPLLEWCVCVNILGFTTRTKDTEMAERVTEMVVGLRVCLCGRSLSLLQAVWWWNSVGEWVAGGWHISIISRRWNYVEKEYKMFLC